MGYIRQAILIVRVVMSLGAALVIRKLISISLLTNQRLHHFHFCGTNQK